MHQLQEQPQQHLQSLLQLLQVAYNWRRIILLLANIRSKQLLD